MSASIKKQFDQEYNKYLMLLHSEIKDVKELALTLGKMYTITKTFKGDALSSDYLDMLKKLNFCELNLPKAYIIKTNSNFERKEEILQVRNIDLFHSAEEILDYIVSATRNYLFDKYLKNTGVDNIDALNYSGLCFETANYVGLLCNSMHIKSKVVRIDCAFDRYLNLLNGFGFHCFVIVSIDEEEYLIDCSYKQFFELKGNLLERLGTQNLNGCYPGIYMLQTPERKTLAREMISKGWIKLTEENTKNYFDGFALSYRNGLYYDLLGNVDFSTDYTYDDYIDFLFTEASQANYEPLEGLGFQKERIKNPNMTFKTDKNMLKKLYY